MALPSLRALPMWCFPLWAPSLSWHLTPGCVPGLPVTWLPIFRKDPNGATQRCGNTREGLEVLDWVAGWLSSLATGRASRPRGHRGGRGSSPHIRVSRGGRACVLCLNTQLVGSRQLSWDACFTSSLLDNGRGGSSSTLTLSLSFPTCTKDCRGHPLSSGEPRDSGGSCRPS